MTPPQNPERIPFTCSLDCGARCDLVALVQDGQLVRIDAPPGRPDLPFGRLDTVERPRLIPCARGRARGRERTAPDRLLYPLRRTGPRGSGSFARISWDEALDEIAERLREVQARYGAEALLLATGAGSISGRGFSGAAAATRFFELWGPVTATSGNMSNHSATIAANWMLGGRLPGSDRATLLDSRLILLWGNNPAETRWGPNTAHFIALARDRGARVVLIDPRYTDTGILADQWIPIRPGSDAALVAAMAYVMETEGLADRAFMASHTAGYEAYRAYVLGQADSLPPPRSRESSTGVTGGIEGGPDRQPKTPEWAAPITGIAADDIRELARAYATLKPAALLPGWGPQRGLYGEQIARALIVLACLSGNAGLRGGGLASVGTRPNALQVDALPRAPSPRGPGRRVSSVAWAEDILQDRLAPPLRMAYIVASNLINRSPDTRANARALEQLDFVVVHEPFLTPTARYADLALPICTDLERSDLITAWANDLRLWYSRQVVEPAGEARGDYWVFGQLAERLGFGEAYTADRSEQEWLDQFLDPARLPAGIDVETLRREGMVRLENKVRLEGEPLVALADFRADPAAHPLPTRSGLIEISNPEAEAYGLPALPIYIEAAPDADGYPLQLVTPHHKHRSNSCLAAVPWLKRLDPQVVWIHPQDAQARGIGDGDRVEVHNERGVVRLPAKVTARIMPGVVCIYQGAWYTPGEDGADEGGCANVLTAHRTSPSGGPATHTVWVEISGQGGVQ